MKDWTEIDENARRERVALWCSASGDIRRWTRWMEEGKEADAAAVLPDAPFVTPDDADFPEALRGHAEVLFTRGRLPAGRRLAVVGSRAVDFEGTRLTRDIVAEVVRTGASIVSGGAIGVDTIAHQTALREGGATVAFLPSALDRLTPARNGRLFAEIQERGALVTEYPPGVSARRYHFYRRNQLIAAFSDAVLVVRAKEEGGTMLTARAALRLGKPLLVVPGSPEDDTSRGCNKLIREGARLVRNAADVLEDLAWSRSDGSSETGEPSGGILLSANARALWEALDGAEADADDLARRARVDSRLAMVALLELEMRGQIVKCPGSRRYRRA